MKRETSQQTVFGTSVLEGVPRRTGDAAVSFPGTALDGSTSFSVDESTLSRHLLLLGGSGCGKTNALCYMMRTLLARLGQDDVAIVFDTKGEFYEMFSRPGDYVIGNSPQFRRDSFTWNIFGEVLADGEDDESVAMNAREIAASLFHDRGSSSQPFFCNAARDIFAGMLLHFARCAKRAPDTWKSRLNNKDLTAAFRKTTSTDYTKIFKMYPDLRSLLTYIGDGTSNQALGVFGELNSMISEYFIGILADDNPQRSISMRSAVRCRGGKIIFIEYDLSIGETLTPVYRLLLDQALKEALGRSRSTGNVYVFADEFKLLPNLQHIDDALNFGRGLGVRVIAGIQSVDQLYDIYGREKGAVLASGFGSIFAFHTNDASSRTYITERFGPNMTAYDYHNVHRNAVVSSERDGHVVEEWDQLNLGVGQAVVGLGYDAPFLFQFARYDG